METVETRIAKAQASGDLEEVKAALNDAKAAGADSKDIQSALDEVEALQKSREAGSTNPVVPPSQGSEEATRSAAEEAELRARAEALKLQGNEKIKLNTKSSAREAVECFTSGLEIRCSDAVLNAQMYSNRAHVRMLLRQFVEAVDDCRKAIELDPKNVKTYWRAAKASLSLELCRNGIDFCEKGLAVEPKNADLIKLRDSCAEKLATQQQRKELAAQAKPQQALPGDFNADEAIAVQEKLQTMTSQLDGMRETIISKQRERLKCALTRTNVNDSPPETKLYSSVGRCFMAEERSTIEEHLDSTITKLDEELPRLNKTYEELEKRQEAADKELQEMIDAVRKQQNMS